MELKGKTVNFLGDSITQGAGASSQEHFYCNVLKEKFGFINPPFNKQDDIIMLHGVSVGEVIALENLAKKIKENFPNKKLVVTTGTKTGQEIAKKKYDGIADFIGTSVKCRKHYIVI